MFDKRSKAGRERASESQSVLLSRELARRRYVQLHVRVWSQFLLFCIRQVYTDGIRHIRSDKRVNEWKTPGKKTIVKCAVNERQVSYLVQV